MIFSPQSGQRDCFDYGTFDLAAKVHDTAGSPLENNEVFRHELDKCMYRNASGTQSSSLRDERSRGYDDAKRLLTLRPNLALTPEWKTVGRPHSVVTKGNRQVTHATFPPLLAFLRIPIPPPLTTAVRRPAPVIYVVSFSLNSRYRYHFRNCCDLPTLKPQDPDIRMNCPHILQLSRTPATPCSSFCGSRLDRIPHNRHAPYSHDTFRSVNQIPATQLLVRLVHDAHSGIFDVFDPSGVPGWHIPILNCQVHKPY